MIQPIYAYGNSILRKQASVVSNTSDIQNIVSDMFDTMYNAKGIGLAAPQIGIDMQIFVVDFSSLTNSGTKKVFINPIITEESGILRPYQEGCLSIPGIYDIVYRYDTIRITYYDADFNFYDEYYTDMYARIIQHEYDHLQGILFIDKLSLQKKGLLQTKLKQISRGNIDKLYPLIFKE